MEGPTSDVYTGKTLHIQQNTRTTVQVCMERSSLRQKRIIKSWNSAWFDETKAIAKVLIYFSHPPATGIIPRGGDKDLLIKSKTLLSTHHVAFGIVMPLT